MMQEENKRPAPLEEVDRNLIIETGIDKPDLRFYDIRRAPFDVYGFYEYRTEPILHRLPTEVAEATSAGVARLERESAGGRVRFCTDSPYVAISVEYDALGRNSHTPLEASGGFDLYEDYPYGVSESRFVKAFQPPYDTVDRFERVVDLPSAKKRWFTLNFPLHSVVKNLYIGVAESAMLAGGAAYRNRRPVVVYGSSIVHGTGPSRPGTTYTSILSRRLNLNIINLGFSGNARGEDAIVAYLAGLEKSVFVCDYDHNAPTVEHLERTHFAMYEAIRAEAPELPYVMISRPDFVTNPSSSAARRDVIIDSFRRARERGDENVYYIDGESFFLGYSENDCTVDGIHPNDLGNTLMADAIECTLRKILSSGDCLG